MADGRPDVLVLGGGPAGCAAASLLARWGHQVVLHTRPAAPGLPLAESLPPSTRRLFDVLGIHDRIDHAGFVRSTGNTVWWGQDVPRIERFADGDRGWQVTTDRLEALLHDHAAGAGVVIETRRATAGDGREVRPHFTLDCTGRAGVLARARRLRRHESQQRTVAMVALWQAARPFDLPDPTHTVIESYQDGWAWSVPDAGAGRYVAVMVDPRTSALSRDAEAQAVYLGEIRKTRQLSRLLAGASLVRGPAGWDASMYHAVRYVDDDVLLVGDAGSFIDPLSSAGVKKALASGWLAAVAVHTSLCRPAMRQAALDFFAAREAEVYGAFRAMTERFLADAASGHADPFWADRAEPHDRSASPASVAAAFEHLRAQPTLRLERDPDTGIEPRPAVHGNEIVLEDRLVRGDRSGGARYAFGVDLIALVHLAPAHASVPGLHEAYNARHSPVPLPDLIGALSTAIAEKWLRWM